jgi:lipopolysaccharide/colanic/teichoic acid biosynthesis glycosyltransferase
MTTTKNNTTYFLKRFLDIAGASIGAGITVLAYIPIALAIKLDSPGPVIFSQERAGKDEQVFRVYKFRTMYLNSSQNGLKPGPNDERTTSVGRFLRRTSLDELPQFFNILRGEMSLVGPRPEQLAFVAHYKEWQRRRFVVKPGLTGWWQVNGRKQPMYEHIGEDIYYVEHCSLMLDLMILCRTIWAVLNGRGAV